MAAKSPSQIPVLTDIISRTEADAAVADASPGHAPASERADAGEPRAQARFQTPDERPPVDETLIAELQTELAAGAYELTEAILHSAFAEMEARIYADISRRLRAELPELMDELLRQRLTRDQES